MMLEEFASVTSGSALSASFYELVSFHKASGFHFVLALLCFS